MIQKNNATKPLIERLGRNSKKAMKINEIQQNAINSYLDKIETNKYIMRLNQCICGNKDGTLISEVDRYGIPTKTYLCEICGTMRTNPYLNEKSLNQFYNSEYRPIYVGTNKFNDDFFKNQMKSGKIIYNFIKDHHKIDDDFIVYEVGCGAGGILQVFKENNCIVAGCDLGNEYVQSGKDNGLDLSVGGIETLKNHKKADVIILNHLLEHITKPYVFLNEIRDLMKEEGILFIALPGILNIKRSYGDLAFYLQSAHVYHFTLTTLDYLLNSSGYSRILGDESIRAIYKKSEYEEINYDNSNAKDIFDYLLNLEKNRRLNIFKLNLRLLLGKVKIYSENILS